MQFRYGSTPPDDFEEINLPRKLRNNAFKKGMAIIAPFWIDGDMREGTIYYKEYQDKKNIPVQDFAQLEYINQYIRKKTEQDTFKTSWAFIVTWEGAKPYGGRDIEVSSSLIT